MPANGDPSIDGPRRALLGGLAGGLTLLAGCGRQGLEPPTSTSPPTSAPPPVSADWADQAYRESENGSLVVAVVVRNPTEAAATGNVTLWYQDDGERQQQTASFSVEAGESQELELTFPELSPGNVSGIVINKELSVDE